MARPHSAQAVVVAVVGVIIGRATNEEEVAEVMMVVMEAEMRE